uniref:HTH CENPB-type domain-containing protein n=1 Tax=Pelodiscus sinensis TaxID=13735 RepID=K7G7M9_PELSI
VIKQIEKGECNCDISRALNMHESSVRTIHAQAEKIKESCKNATPVSVKKVVHTRSNLMENMERRLSMWIEDQTQRKMPVNLAVIQEKAKALYDAVKLELNEIDAKPFNASHGWLKHFKKRSNLHNIKITGEAAAAADTEAAESFPAIFETIIKEDGYLSKQVFNLDETGLYWKRTPARTYISCEEAYAPGFKAAKDHMTVMLCTNVNKDCKLKLAVYCSANPRALARYSNNRKMILWRSNAKAWVTASIFTDYFCNCLTAELKDYCLQENLAFKILLVMNQGILLFALFICQKTFVLFLPPNTTSLIQPLDQGAIAAFKVYYFRRTFARLIRETDGENSLIKEFWRKFNIKDAIIAEAWAEVSSSCLNAVWCHEFREFDTEIAEAKKQIVALAHGTGLEEVNATDVQELLNSHGEE